MVHGSKCIESQFSTEEMEITWQSFLPPIRPSPEDLKVYEDCITRIGCGKNPRVIILGVTPELRRLAIRHNCKVTATDLHTVMIKAMNRLMDNLQVDGGDEALIKSDWLAMPLREESHDLILADCSINSLTKTETEMLLTESKRLLKRDGYFCTRVMVRSDEGVRQSMSNIFSEYRKGFPQNDMHIFRDLYLEILCSLEAYDPRTRKSSIDRARKGWRKLYRDGKITDHEFEAFENILAEGEYCPTLLGKSELEEAFSRHYEIVFTKYDEAWLMGCSPIYCLKRI